MWIGHLFVVLVVVLVSSMEVKTVKVQEERNHLMNRTQRSASHSCLQDEFCDKENYFELGCFGPDYYQCDCCKSVLERLCPEEICKKFIVKEANGKVSQCLPLDHPKQLHMATDYGHRRYYEGCNCCNGFETLNSTSEAKDCIEYDSRYEITCRPIPW